MRRLHALREAWRWRRKRQNRLVRALWKRRELRCLADRIGAADTDGVLVFCTIRNEALRLPYFLAHYRSLGVGHFLFVDNDSDDGGREFLLDQHDTSVWHTRASYRASRFGMDWMQWLLIRHGHDRWCLTVDADELLLYPHHDTRPLPALTAWMEARGLRALGTLMLELYPKGPIGAQCYHAGQDPVSVLEWYDCANYTITRKADIDALWIQGGPRSRVFLSDRPERGPTLTKVPLVRWNRRHVYLNSTHSLLPRFMNREIYDDDGGEKLSGVLLHTKFLPEVVAKSAEEKHRRQHFGEPGAFDAYYDAVIGAPELWCEASTRYLGWRQLEAEGIMSRGEWA